MFALHGEAYYRRVEREVLARLLAEPRAMVIATGGSIVNDADELRAAPRALHDGVAARAPPRITGIASSRRATSGPMAENPHAFAELRALLAARAKLYARADHTIDTSGKAVRDVVAALATSS